MASVAQYQRQLLEQTQRFYDETPISAATQHAFLATPRHLFVKRYRYWGTKAWHEVAAHNVTEHLATLYTNRPLILFGDDDDDVPSTISQPSFVLRMLDMLQLQPGHSVFELGAGSGWNAALMGHLVGPNGPVYSLEIIPELAQMAADTCQSLGISNVSIISGDGGEGYAPGAPYDRAIFTAGAYDLPPAFYEQMGEASLLLAVIKSAGGGDNLVLLHKTADHFESLESTDCGFVQLRGKYQDTSLESIKLVTWPAWLGLRQQEVSTTPFWWGGSGKAWFAQRTHGIRSFLGIVEPGFRTFESGDTPMDKRQELFFGLWDEAHHSLALARNDRLLAYGNSVAKEQLLSRIRQWVELGMPSASSFTLQVHRRGVPLHLGERQWLVSRAESPFLWTLDI